MNIGFIVNHPTQFEVPFYKYVSSIDHSNKLDVFYLENSDDKHYDKELGRNIKWGFDLYNDYSCFFLEQNKEAAFIQFLENKKYDLIIVNGYKNQYAGFSAICRARNIPVALRMDTVLFNQPFWKIMLRKLLLKSEYNAFDRFLVTGKVSRDYLSEMGINNNRINIFSYCVDNDFFSFENKPVSETGQQINAVIKKGNGKVILTVAKFMKRETPWDAIKAFALLNRQDISLVLVGDGEERSALEAYAAQYPHLKIHFTGYVNYTDLPHYYHNADVFIHAAKDEPWGVSVQEAIAGGCSVICSNKVGAAFDMIVEGNNGFTYEFGNYLPLAEKIEKALLIDEHALAKTNKKILSWWNYETMWKEILKAAQAVK